jgi:hypothetical protein
VTAASTARSFRSKLAALAAAGLSLALLAGCAAGPALDPQVSPTTSLTREETSAPSSEPTNTPTTEAVVETETAEPLVLPTCEEMNPMLTSMHDGARQNTNMEAVITEVNLDHFHEIAGPTAATAMAAATQVRGCWYPIYPDGHQPSEWIAELSKADQQPLIDALSSDPSITDVSSAGATAFTYDVNREETHDTIMVTYIFIGSAWIIDYNGVEHATVTPDVINRLTQPLKDLNPSLA